MASRLYKAGITRPWTRHVQPCHYNMTALHFFCNIYHVIVFNPCDTNINTVCSGLLKSIPRWGASHNWLSWWAGCTTLRPHAAEINQWKWGEVVCFIPSETESLECTAGAVRLKWVEPRWLSILSNSQNYIKRYHGNTADSVVSLWVVLLSPAPKSPICRSKVDHKFGGVVDPAWTSQVNLWACAVEGTRI